MTGLCGFPLAYAVYLCVKQTMSFNVKNLPLAPQYRKRLQQISANSVRNIHNHAKVGKTSATCNNKRWLTWFVFFRFREAKARHILNHRQTFERPSLGNLKVVRKSADGLKYSEQTFASRNLKNNCNVLLRAIKVQKERSKTAARLYT